jgi:sulfite dehydrogenase
MALRKLIWVLVTVITATLAFGAVQNEEPAGKKILDTACTVCHSLKEVEKFKGFYKRDDWQDVVVTMIKYGADVKDQDVPVLVDYLTKTYGSSGK